MSGEVALPEDAETRWNDESLAAARELNVELTTGSRWFGSVLPVGDGVGFAARWRVTPRKIGTNTVAVRIIQDADRLDDPRAHEVADRADQEPAQDHHQEERRRDPEVAALIGPAVRVEEVRHDEQGALKGESILGDG